MCGRFTQHYTWAEVHAFLGVFGAPQNLQPHYDIASTTCVDVVRSTEDGERELIRMRWGLIPAWWKKPLKELPSTFNARAESVAEKPMFRSAFRSRRCILPASGFYGWTSEPSSKQPHLFTAADCSPLLASAGLWEASRNPETREEVWSCTMILSGASSWMEAYHDRMPILRSTAQFDPWLGGEMTATEMQPASEEALRAWPVSRRLNRTGQGDDDPTIIDDYRRKRWEGAAGTRHRPLDSLPTTAMTSAEGGPKFLNEPIVTRPHRPHVASIKQLGQSATVCEG